MPPPFPNPIEKIQKVFVTNFPFGQRKAASSIPVVVASDQPSIPITLIPGQTSAYGTDNPPRVNVVRQANQSFQNSTGSLASGATLQIMPAQSNDVYLFAATVTILVQTGTQTVFGTIDVPYTTAWWNGSYTVQLYIYGGLKVPAGNPVVLTRRDGTTSFNVTIAANILVFNPAFRD